MNTKRSKTLQDRLEKFWNLANDTARSNSSLARLFVKSELIDLLRQTRNGGEKLQFIGSVLNASSVDNEAFGKFVSLVENDYAAFANSVSLKEEVEAYTKLLALQKELARLLSLKAIA